ncbi:hypothetical protein XELAEV_18009016mg [Xenopus laevis]|uniref:Uncharacterized protein n=1 Tax=Xenopus laevis TaxID=8355 RepID=A0A974DRV7_XENLA|nr:hypothetical protein XELAEV_18009016mg [Xenopus laevis]
MFLILPHQSPICNDFPVPASMDYSLCRTLGFLQTRINCGDFCYLFICVKGIHLILFGLTLKTCYVKMVLGNPDLCSDPVLLFTEADKVHKYVGHLSSRKHVGKDTTSKFVNKVLQLLVVH